MKRSKPVGDCLSWSGDEEEDNAWKVKKPATKTKRAASTSTVMSNGKKKKADEPLTTADIPIIIDAVVKSLPSLTSRGEGSKKASSDHTADHNTSDDTDDKIPVRYFVIQ